MKDNVIERVLKTTRNYGMFKAGDTVLVAVSGGPDSVFLMLALKFLRAKLTANYGQPLKRSSPTLKKEPNESQARAASDCRADFAFRTDGIAGWFQLLRPIA